MATTAADPVFIDTNILVYAQQAHSPFHAPAVARIQALAAAGQPLWISRQILREYLSVMSRPGALTAPIPVANLVADVRRFQRQFHTADEGAPVTARLLTLLSATHCAGKQVHDANVVATMLEHSVVHLLTHNVADFQRFAGYVTVIPLIP